MHHSPISEHFSAKQFLILLAFVIQVIPSSAQITMTFDTGPNQTGFSFSGWSGLGGILYPTNAGVGDIAQITKNSLTYDVVSFQTRPFGNGNGLWRATSDKGDSYDFIPNSGSGWTTHTLNWVGISWLRVSLVNTGNQGTNQSFDFDNLVYFENNAPPCNISLDGVSKLNATCCTSNGIIIVTPVSCTCVGVIEYSVNNGGSWQTSNFFGNLAVGNYHVKIRDSGNILCEDAYIGNPVVVTAVPDVTLPVAVCQNSTVQLNSAGQASIAGAQLNNGSTDNCDFAGMTYTANPSNFNCSNIGANIVTLTVTDNCGNTKTCTSTVTVQNNIPPTAVCKNATVGLGANGTLTLNPTLVDNGSTFNCGAPSLSVSPNTFTCSNIGPNSVTLTATGSNNLTSTCMATVTIQDITPPTSLCKNATVQLDVNGMASITTADINNNSSDACGISGMTVNPSSFTCSNVGNNIVTLTVTDNYSNSSTCTATVTVKALSLGNLVYKDNNRNGVFDGGDTGINGVLCKLYQDNGNGVLDSGDGAAVATFTTTTLNSQAGSYLFEQRCPGNYIVEIAASNFSSGGPLYDTGLAAALVSSPIGGASDPDDDADNDDNGDAVAGYGVASQAITLGFASEPTSDGDADNNTNLSLDFGFKTPVNVSIDLVNLSEGTGGSSTAFNFTVTRTDNTEPFSLTVNTTDGTATVGDNDYTGIVGGTISFTAGGSLTQTLTVQVTHDNKVEAAETFNVVLSGAPPGVNITNATGTGTITNDDSAIITLTGGGGQQEGANFVFSATLDNPVQGGFTVSYVTNNGTATTADNDYTDNDNILSFAGNSGEVKTINVQSTPDNKVEGDETFTVSLITVSNAPPGVSTAGSPKTGTIQNDDASVLSIASNVSQPEATTPQTFSIVLSNPVAASVVLWIRTYTGTATSDDYTGIGPGVQVITMPAGTTSVPVNIPILNDSKVEADETYTLRIDSLVSVSLPNVSLGTRVRTGTIQNDDTATLTLSGGASKLEGSSGTTGYLMSVTLSAAVQGGFTANYTTNDGTATTTNNDYQDNDGALVFTGLAGETQSFTVLANGDLNIENNESFQVSINNLSGGVHLSAITISGSPQTATILNDELDFGDLYDFTVSIFIPSLLSSNGPRHTAVPGMYLGTSIDAETDAQSQSSFFTDGDDLNGLDDEDGVTFSGPLVKGTTAEVEVVAAAPGFLSAWIDFEDDYTFIQPGNKVFTNVPLVVGVNNLSFTVPSTASTTTYASARFRYSSATGLSFDGPAPDGEVEDYFLTIIDNSFSINDVTITEGNSGTTDLVFTISRSTNSTTCSVNYAITGGTATSGSDYAPLAAGTVNFTAGGALSQTVTITVNGDIIVENNETIVMTLSSPVNGGIADGSGTGTINNDDTATITLSGGQSQNEGNSPSPPTNYTFVATLDNPVQGGLSIAYATNDGTATTADNDYLDNDGSLTFTGNAGESYNIVVQGPGDTKVELNETFTVTLGAISGAPAGVSAAGSPQTGTITNDDAATVALAANVSQTEAISPQVFSVTLSNPVDVPVSVTFSTTDGTATTADNDYTGIAGQTVTFPANSTTTQSVNVGIINDTKVEANELYNTAIGSLSASGRNVSLGTSARTGTIQNDDNATVTLSGPTAQNEGNSGQTAFLFSATLNNAVQGGFTLPYSTNDGTATTADNDYIDNDGPALVFTGAASEVKTITVLVNGDTKVEANETFNVALGAITGAPAGVSTAGSPLTSTINNDEIDWGDGPDSLPTSSFSNGARHQTLIGFHLGASVDGDADGQFGSLANGDDTDADGDDEDGVTLPDVFVRGIPTTITVNASQAGKLDAWMDFNWNRVLGDLGEKIFNNVALAPGDNVLTITVPAGAVVGSSYIRFRFSSAGGLSPTGVATDGEVEDYRTTIVNNQFSISDATITEGNSSTTNLDFIISRTTNSTSCSVNYAITSGTATSGSDYAPLAAGTVNFTAGGGLSQTVTVSVTGDLTVENNETIVMTLSSPVGGGIADGSGTGTINNDDSATVTLSGGQSQNEGNSPSPTTNYTFVATLDNPVQGGFSIAYANNDGTATTTDNDYLNNDGSLTFSGNAGESYNIVVQVPGDTKVELNETFTVTLGTISGAPAGVSAAGSPQTGTITNDDAAIVALAANVSQSEAISPQVFSVTLSNPVDVPVSVTFSTTDGTATTADNDYTGIAGQTVTFPANTTTAQSVNVGITSDIKVEADELYNTAIGSLSASGRNVSLGTSTRTGTILNNDNATVTLSGGTSQNEGNSGATNFLFTATLNNPVQGGFSANYTTNNGTATTADNDYIDNDNTLVFSGLAGEVKTFTVQVNGDLNIENDETFQTAINSLSGVINPPAVTIAGSPQTSTIINDEQDWGDAPTAAQSGFGNTYPTLAADNGARHAAAPGGLRLGATLDADLDGQPNANATGDGADEDGVTLPGALVLNTTASITVVASGAGLLNAWVDFSRDGDWNDAGEQVLTNQAVVAGSNALSFSVPAGGPIGNSFARFRITSAPGTAPDGPAADGEVEDYAVNIVNTQFSLNDPTINEGNAGTSNLAFVITRTNNASACSINYAITGGTASTADNDYQVLASGTANFSAGGALTQTINVVVNGDVKVELNETVEMTLSNPVNGSILDGDGLGTIVNDDAAVITVSNPSITEGDTPNLSTLTFNINMSNPSDAAVSVNYATVDNTATLANNDYQATSGVHTFTPGQQAKTVAVTIVGDCAIEPNEILLLRLSSLVNNGRNITLNGGGATLDGSGTINNDDALPVISCPANISRNVDPGVCTTNVTLPLPTISSICGTSTLEYRYRLVNATGAPLGAFSAYIPSGSNTLSFTTGRYEIEWRTTDGSGASVCSFYLTVIDNQPPTIVCPPNQTLTAGATCSAVIGAWSPVTLSDNCTPNGQLVVEQSPAPTYQLMGHNSSVIVELGARDLAGNRSSCTFSITLKDVTTPFARCKNATVNLGSNGIANLSPNTVNNGSSDNCAFNLSVTPNTFGCGNIGANIVVLRATDAAGNSSTCTARVTVQDLTGPTALCKNPTIFLDDNGQVTLTPAQVDNGSTDACGIAMRTIDRTMFDCSDIGSAQLVHLTVRDNNGNSATCQSYVTVKDNTPPQAICEDVTVQLGSNGRVTVYPAELADLSTDNCSVWSYSPLARTYYSFNLGLNYLTITVKDWSGNAATCISEVTVEPFTGLSEENNSRPESDWEDAVMVLYPNPAEKGLDQVMVAFELPEDQTFQLRIFDLNGRMVYSQENSGFKGENTLPLQLSSLSDGVYMVDFRSGDQRAVKRLVVFSR